MKNLYKYSGIVILGMISFNSLGQVNTEVNKQVKKEVKMEDVNGEKTLTIDTEENGVKTQEVYKGEAAEAKLAEMQTSNAVVEEQVQEQAKIENVNGVKTMTITKTENGVTSTEVLTGEAADAKQKELEGNTPPQQKPMKSSLKKVEVRKIEKKANN